MRSAPSIPTRRTARATSPDELVRRLLARFGDRSFIHGIEIGAPPPERERRTQPRRDLPKDALWAYISAPKALQAAPADPSPEEQRARDLAEWEVELIQGALRDDFCRAGGRPLVGWSVSGQFRGHSDGSYALNQRFPNPSPGEFRERVDLVGRRYGFRPESVRLLRPRELAPIVIVKTDRGRSKFVADVPSIMDLLDPRSSSKGHDALTFEGFFFEARDDDGPFVRVINAYRGVIMGGVWSWDRCFSPYPGSGFAGENCPD
jgi:hypothetical protein